MVRPPRHEDGVVQPRRREVTGDCRLVLEDLHVGLGTDREQAVAIRDAHRLAQAAEVRVERGAVGAHDDHAAALVGGRRASSAARPSARRTVRRGHCGTPPHLLRRPAVRRAAVCRPAPASAASGRRRRRAPDGRVRLAAVRRTSTGRASRRDPRRPRWIPASRRSCATCQGSANPACGASGSGPERSTSQSSSQKSQMRAISLAGSLTSRS